jgi:DNA-binding response OmpR family regulator
LAKSPELAHINKYLKIPVQDFVVKPIIPATLYLRIKKILDTTSRGETINNGELVVEDKKKMVQIKGVALSLTPREYRLLRYLVANKGRVLSRQSILNHVWGYDSYVIDRNVDVYIGYISRKLSKIDKKEYIKTIPSFGYMLVDLEKESLKGTKEQG